MKCDCKSTKLSNTGGKNEKQSFLSVSYSRYNGDKLLWYHKLLFFRII